MTGAPIVALSRGVCATPQMGWESSEMSSYGNLVLGNGNPTDFHAITVNSAGGAGGFSGPQLILYKLTAKTTSVQVANIGHGNTAGVTLWYDLAASNGWILAWASGIGDITVSYRENQ